jgi:hypothetical protein
MKLFKQRPIGGRSTLRHYERQRDYYRRRALAAPEAYGAEQASRHADLYDKLIADWHAANKVHPGAK